MTEIIKLLANIEDQLKNEVKKSLTESKDKTLLYKLLKNLANEEENAKQFIQWLVEWEKEILLTIAQKNKLENLYQEKFGQNGAELLKQLFIKLDVSLEIMVKGNKEANPIQTIQDMGNGYLLVKKLFQRELECWNSNPNVDKPLCYKIGIKDQETRSMICQQTKKIALWGGDKIGIHSYSLENGKINSNEIVQFKHSNVQVVLLPNNVDEVYSISSDKIMVWNLQNKEIVQTTVINQFKLGEFVGAKLISDKKISYVTTKNIMIFDVKHQSFKIISKEEKNKNNQIVHYSSSQDYIAMVLNNNLKAIQWFGNDNQKNEEKSGLFKGHNGNILSLYVDSKHNILVSSDDKCKIFVWDLSTYRCLTTIDSQDGASVRCIQPLSNGDILVGTNDQSLYKLEFDRKKKNGNIENMVYLQSNLLKPVNNLYKVEEVNSNSIPNETVFN